MSVVHKISNYIFVMNLFFSFVFIRLPDIINFSILRFGIYLIFLMGCIFGIISCYKTNKKITFSLLFFIFSIVIHAFSNFYQPSLKQNVSIQNYILNGIITSDFIFTQTRLYMIFFVFFIFPAISFFNYISKDGSSKKIIKIFYYCLSLCVVINCFTFFYQGLFNINFLSQGSGTSLGANRPPGLLDDSGAASFFLAIFGFTYFSSIFLKSISNKYKFFNFLIFILCLVSGLLNNSRSFFLGLFLSVFILIVIKLIIEIKNKRYKLILLITSTSLLILIITKIVTNYKNNNSSIYRINNELKRIGLNGDLFNIYSVLDFQRASHLQIMWENIKENFFMGTGLGSFAINFYNQINKLKFETPVILDIATNSIFSIISDLGFIGLSVISFCTLLYIKYAINFIKNKHSLDFYAIFILYIIPILGTIPFFIVSNVFYMFIYPSLSYISCLIIAPWIVNYTRSNHFQNNFFSLFFYLCSIYLIIVSLILAITAPPVPLFKWKERGTAQVPMPLGILPQPEGQTEKKKIYFSDLLNDILGGNSLLIKPLDGDVGQWFKPQTEIIVVNPTFRIFVGPETRHFPVKVSVQFYSKEREKSEENLTLQQPTWVNLTVPKQKTFESCFDDVSMTAFCYYHISVIPAWEPSLFKSIGFYIENQYIK
ncbi:O-antigen polymerase [Silvanigrella aquatica]|uniref:O-antigen ligase-related domain-containing protein n=1 Tax=Silvanigrella aquatica TaxID=1915309 RepID=A0A1L4CYF2_9BACT|nr:O-antigen polymerase [Silvanigrella aquatica]APJ02978.1 hypothetical protein AXG55_03230 [Silvanigrella aquatica]